MDILVLHPGTISGCIQLAGIVVELREALIDGVSLLSLLQ
jgi:hypothetical protein